MKGKSPILRSGTTITVDGKNNVFQTKLVSRRRSNLDGIFNSYQTMTAKIPDSRSSSRPSSAKSVRINMASSVNAVAIHYDKFKDFSGKHTVSGKNKTF